MNKLSKKLFFRIFMIILIIFCISFMLNNYFLYRYYLHEMKKNLSRVSNEIEVMEFIEIKAMELEDLTNLIKSMEKKYNVIITYEALDEDIDDITSSIIEKFHRKNIALSKFWIGEAVLKKIKQGKKVNKLYNQGKIKSSFLARFMKKGNMVVVIGVFITHDNDTIKIINQFYLYLILFSTTLIIILIWFLSKRIIYPLEELKNIAIDISNLKFKKVDIKTGDEIEELSKSINIMSEKLEKAQSELKEKNENLKIFISNISHELKTPLALVKAYSMGIKDNLDDGTYIDIILKQIDNISDLADNLLKLSKLEKDSIQKKVFSIENLFSKVFENYMILIEKENIAVSVNKEDLDDPYILADQEKIEVVLNNLINNAIKYTINDKIEINIKNVEAKVLFTIKNGINLSDKKHIDRIWEPFYVIEASRNKKLSGTGLGLSIVGTILKNHNIEYGFNLYENIIEFYIYFQGESYCK